MMVLDTLQNFELFLVRVIIICFTLGSPMSRRYQPYCSNRQNFQNRYFYYTLNVFDHSSQVYKFSCSRDANISYIGMTTRHLGTRIQEYLHHKTIKSAIREHFEICQNCKLNNTDLNVLKFYALVIQNMLQRYTRSFTHKKTQSTTQ